MKAFTFLVLAGILNKIQGSPQVSSPAPPLLTDLTNFCVETDDPSPTFPNFPCYQADTIFVEGSVNQGAIKIEECQQLCKNTVCCKVL